jgi:hypothetical protein
LLSLTEFEDQWRSLRADRVHGSIEYLDASSSVRAVVIAHFRQKKSGARYGVYVVRQRDTSVVLYIGKAGTVTQEGGLKDQDLPGRLTNTRGRESSQIWFAGLCTANGPLLVEYVLLDATPISPATAEATLLQALLNDTGRLPCGNKTL